MNKEDIRPLVNILTTITYSADVDDLVREYEEIYDCWDIEVPNSTLEKLIQYFYDITNYLYDGGIEYTPEILISLLEKNL